ncbi:MAG: hypothetical protein GF400_11720 [Candidatus Eisenbacteria bacterium]|nr:hypothetical protein [Candidatus Eisenbacteria bacterium]
MSTPHAGTMVTAALVAAMLVGAVGAAAQDDEERRREALKSLPYVSWTEKEVDEKEHGVTVYDSLRAYDGYTLYVGKTHVTLVDMSGEAVHSWRNPTLKRLEHAKLTPDGHAYVILPRRGVFELDWDGEIVWSGEALVHHDFDMEPGGDLLAIAYDEVVMREFGPTPILSDKIVRLGRDGTVTDVWRLHEHRDDLAQWCSEEALTTVSEDVPEDDWSHANTLEIIREPGETALPVDLGMGDGGDGYATGEAGARHPAFEPGNALICVRNLDFIGVVDLDSGEIVWGWGPGEIDHPHQPTLLANGNVLLFDNGFFRGWSRVIEYDPVADEIVWEYKESDPYDFFSRGRGACQKLPNGNVLITESAKGRVLEVTPDGEVVWNFLNPSRQRDRRGTFYRSFRYDRDVMDRIIAEQGE